MSSKIRPLVEGAKKVGKQIWPTDKRLAKDIARRTKDIGKKFPETKEGRKALLAEAKKQGINNAANVHRRKNGRNQLIELVAKKQKESVRLRDTPVTLGGTARTAVDAALIAPRAVTALGSAGSLSLRGAQTVPATATVFGKGGRFARFARGGALVQGALQAGKGGYLALGKGEKADAARRKALRNYASGGLDDEGLEVALQDLEKSIAEGRLEKKEAEKIAKELIKTNRRSKQFDRLDRDIDLSGSATGMGLSLLSPENLGRAAEAGFFNPAESTYASFKAGQLMFQDPAGDFLKSAAEAGKSKAERQRESFALASQKLALLRGDAVRDKYTSKMDPQFRPSGDDEAFFAGRVGDPEFSFTEQDEFSTAPKTYAALVESRRSDDEAIKERAMAYERKAAKVQDREPRSWEEVKKLPNMAAKLGKISFDENDRRAFLQAAQSGQLLEMFDADGDGKLSREERRKFFLSNDEGFRSKAQAAGIYADATPPTDPEEAPLGIDPNTGDPIMPQDPPTPPTPPPPVDELAEKGLEGAPPIQYEPENIVEETREERPKTEAEKRIDLIAEGRKLGLRTQDFGSFGGFKVATDIAAGRRPASGVTALTGSVGRLGDAPRRLGTKAGRYRREARRLEQEGYRTEAGKLRGAAAVLSVNEPNVKSRADILEEQRRARENAEIAENQRRQALAAARKREEERRKREEEPLVTAGEKSINSD